MAYRRKYSDSGSGNSSSAPGASSRAYWANKKKSDAAKAALPKHEIKRLTNPSIYQVNIFEDIAVGNGHTMVQARAGCGKTSTIMEALYYLPPGKTAAMMAFNRSIADELKARCPPGINIEIGTSHSFGMKAVTKRFGKINVDKKKCVKFVESIVGLPNADMNENEEKYQVIDSITKLVSLAKQWLFDDAKSLDDLIDQYEIDVDFIEYSRENIIEVALKVLQLCKMQYNSIDFDDMLWFVHAYDLTMPKFDYVFVDEFQDFNRCQIGMIKRMCF